MRRVGISLVAVACCNLALAAPASKDRPKPTPSLIGTWRLVSVDDKDSMTATYTFRADGMATFWYQMGTLQQEWEVPYVVGSSAGRDWIDFLDDGDGPPRPAILKFDADRLTICDRPDGADRPRVFGEEGSTVAVYERVQEQH